MTTYTRKMKMAELDEAVTFYASVDFDPDQARPLMDLLQEQTEYYQRRFWNEVEIIRSHHAYTDRRAQLEEMGWL